MFIIRPAAETSPPTVRVAWAEKENSGETRKDPSKINALFNQSKDAYIRSLHPEGIQLATLDTIKSHLTGNTLALPYNGVDCNGLLVID